MPKYITINKLCYNNLKGNSKTTRKGVIMDERSQQTTGANILNPDTLEPTGRTVGQKPTYQEDLQDAAKYEYKPYGLDLIDLDKIKLDTQEGQYSYLTSLVDNALAINTERLKSLEDPNLINNRDSEREFQNLSSRELELLEEKTRRSLDIINAQKSILIDLDFSNSSVVQALEPLSKQYYKKALADGVSEAASTKFLLMQEAADSLYVILADKLK